MKNLPRSPAEFLRETCWQGLSNYDYFATAYLFFLDNVDRDVLTTEVAPGFYALKFDNKYIQLTQWLQAINFDEPVFTEWLEDGTLLWRFEALNEARIGQWFTLGPTPREKLAIDDAAIYEHAYRLTSIQLALESTISDAYVDWRANEGRKAKYRKGRAEQVFIPEAWNYVERFDVKTLLKK